MDKHFDLPGSPAWHARRAACFNAGDAPAMLGCSSLKTRTELLHELHTGVSREFSDYVQERVIDPGHVVEARCRPLAEDIYDEELQVLAGSLAVAGLSRPLGASLDGLLFMDDGTWECKSMNDELRAAMPHIGRDSHHLNDGKALPKDKRVQMEQQLFVTGAKRALFTAGELDDDDEVKEERHAWYYPDPALRAEILAGWKQFDADLAAYVPRETTPAVVAEPVQALPAVSVIVEGTIVIRENFDAFETAARHFLQHRLIREPKTDQDFADLDLQIKAMKSAEAALDAAEAGWIAQIDPVSAAKRRKDMLSKLMRDNRLMAEKLLASEKERRRGEIVAGGVKALADHIAALNVRLGKPYMPAVPADFGGAIKGKKSLSSMEDAVASELARAKIAANEAADRIQANLTTLREKAANHAFLFPDTAVIVQKAPDDLATLVTARIAEHEAKERAKEEEQRERIRKEERERAEAEQRKAQEAEDGLIASLWANARRIEHDSVPYIQKAIGMFESGAKDWENDPRPRVAEAVAAARAEMKAKLDAAKAREEAAATPPAAAPITAAAAVAPLSATPNSAPAAAPAPAVIQMPTRAAAAPATRPTLSLGQIKERIAPLQITADGLATLGFTGLKERGSVLFQEADYAYILAAIVTHVQSLQAKEAA